jgi:hypothetical protein
VSARVRCRVVARTTVGVVTAVERYEGPSRGAFAERFRYAEALAAADILPAAYKRKPANVLVAIEYGTDLGVSPLTAMSHVHVINGKPTVSAELMRAMVHVAGHRFRVIESTSEVATVEVERSDDRDFPTRVSFSMADAERAGLLGSASWQKYPAAMLSARATSAVVRLACPEVVMGVGYVPEELGAVVDEDGEPYVEAVTFSPPGTDPYLDDPTIEDEVDDPASLRAGALLDEVRRRYETLDPRQRGEARAWRDLNGIPEYGSGRVTVEQLERTIEYLAELSSAYGSDVEPFDTGGTVEAPPVRPGEAPTRKSPRDAYFARQGAAAALVDLDGDTLRRRLVSLHTNGTETSSNAAGFTFSDWSALNRYLDRIEAGDRLVEDEGGSGWRLVAAVPT